MHKFTIGKKARKCFSDDTFPPQLGKSICVFDTWKVGNEASFSIINLTKYTWRGLKTIQTKRHLTCLARRGCQWSRVVVSLNVVGRGVVLRVVVVGRDVVGLDVVGNVVVGRDVVDQDSKVVKFIRKRYNIKLNKFSGSLVAIKSS